MNSVSVAHLDYESVLFFAWEEGRVGLVLMVKFWHEYM